MKTHKFTAIVAIMLMGLFMASCDEEKDIIVIDGNIPIKTSTLYIVGDATPALWDVNNMYPLEMSLYLSTTEIFRKESLKRTLRKAVGIKPPAYAR